MARAKSAKRGKRANNAERAERLARFRRGIATATTVLLVAGCAGAITFGRPMLKERVVESRASEVSPTIIWPGDQSSPDGTWLPASTRSRLESIVVRGVSPNPFDYESLEATRRTLLATGWLRTCALRRTGEGEVRVSGEWRVPGAVVRMERARGEWVVSTRGELIDTEDNWGLVAIVGVRMDPPDRFGQEWIGGEVDAALGLIDRLADRPWLKQVAAIDVARFRESNRLEIVTDKANRLIWGGEPQSRSPGEASDERKLAHLDELFRRFGRIDADHPLLDVRFDRVEIPASGR